MDDMLKVCAAAFFRGKGRDVVTLEEFLMGVSLNNRWMPYSDAEKLLSVLVSEKIVSADEEYVRPCFDVAVADVPAGYRPPKDLLSNRQEDVLRTLIRIASESGMGKSDLLSKCRSLQKRMNIDVEVAAVIVLRDSGADVSGLIGTVCDAVSRR